MGERSEGIPKVLDGPGDHVKWFTWIIPDAQTEGTWQIKTLSDITNDQAENLLRLLLHYGHVGTDSIPQKGMTTTLYLAL